MNRIARIMITAVSAAALSGRLGPLWAGVIMSAGYLLLLIARPVHACPNCGGRKVVRNGRSFRPCKRCKGSGKAYRRGAILMHRLLREHAWPWVHDRIVGRIADRTGDDS